MPRWPLTTVALALLALLPAQAAAQDEVFVDKGSPAGKEYAVPLDSARQSGSGHHGGSSGGGSSGGGSRGAALFGAGIKPPGSGGGGSGGARGSGETGGGGSRSGRGEAIGSADQRGTAGGVGSSLSGGLKPVVAKDAAVRAAASAGKSGTKSWLWATLAALAVLVGGGMLGLGMRRFSRPGF